MVVGTYHGQNFIKAAEITTAINNSTGEGEARILAGHVYIGNTQTGQPVDVEIAGKLNVTDLTANLIQSKVSELGTLLVNAIGCSGGASVSGLLNAAGNIHTPYLELDGVSVGLAVYDVRVVASGDGYKLQKQTITGSGWVDAGSFNGAASVDFSTEGLWSSGSKELTLTNGKTKTVNIPDGTSWSGTYIGLQSQVPTMAVSVLVGGKSISGTVDATGAYNAGYDAGTTAGYTSGYSAGYAVGYVAGQAAGSTASYNNGWNGALAACGIAGGGTVYTGTWYGTLYVAPTGGATPVNNCVGQATGHAVDAK